MRHRMTDLQQHEAEGQPQDQQRLLADQAQIGRHADGDEEQPEQQSLEGLDVGLEFVAKFAVREQHAGQKSAQRQRQAHLTHQQRGSDAPPARPAAVKASATRVAATIRSIGRST